MSNFDFTNKVAIVTGSSRGIGKITVIQLLKKGVKVVINGRDPERLQKASEEISKLGFDVFAVQADIGNYKDCEKLINQTILKYGKIDILINNAGLAMEGSIENSPPETFEKVFNANILGQLFPTKAALPHIKKTKGSIIFNSSIAGFFGLPNFSAYSSSKMSLTAMAQSLKIELTGTGIHVGINYIGFAENESQKTFYNEKGKLEVMEVRENFKKMPIDKIADKIIKGIEKRKYKTIFSFTGKLLLFSQRFIPRIFEKLMLMTYKKQLKEKISTK